MTARTPAERLGEIRVFGQALKPVAPVAVSKQAPPTQASAEQRERARAVSMRVIAHRMQEISR